MKLFYRRMVACILVFAACSCTSIYASAVNMPNEMETAAAYLHEKGIMVGNDYGDMLLSKGLTRAELAAIITRITANPEHLNAEKEFYTKQCPFSDVPNWAKLYVGYCAANHYVNGYGNGFYGSDDPVTSAAACTVVLRCLGDNNIDWDYTTACQRAISIGLASRKNLEETEISRGNMAILIYRTMVKMGYNIDVPQDNDVKEMENTDNGALNRNSDGSINVPSDGSRYIPQSGDVIRCDDGSNYTITDVSRYDKNMFASGPVGDLPEPTCDWSSFPEVELPEAEVRRYKTESGDYLFVRNLYESLRMQYTLQNLAGNHPDTSEDGKLKYGAKGTPLVHIKLTINDDLTPQVFWPWRDSELENLFNSCPPGTYSVECWDVYKDGVFQRTEYKVHVI